MDLNKAENILTWLQQHESLVTSSPHTYFLLDYLKGNQALWGFETVKEAETFIGIRKTYVFIIKKPDHLEIGCVNPQFEQSFTYKNNKLELFDFYAPVDYKYTEKQLAQSLAELQKLLGIK